MNKTACPQSEATSSWTESRIPHTHTHLTQLIASFSHLLFSCCYCCCCFFFYQIIVVACLYTYSWMCAVLAARNMYREKCCHTAPLLVNSDFSIIFFVAPFFHFVNVRSEKKRKYTDSTFSGVLPFCRRWLHKQNIERAKKAERFQLKSRLQRMKKKVRLTKCTFAQFVFCRVVVSFFCFQFFLSRKSSFNVSEWMCVCGLHFDFMNEIDMNGLEYGSYHLYVPKKCGFSERCFRKWHLLIFSLNGIFLEWKKIPWMVNFEALVLTRKYFSLSKW